MGMLRWAIIDGQTMPNLTTSIRSAAASVPGARRVWGGLNRVLRGPAPAEFSGWGMQTQAHTPWHHGGGDDTARDFLEANKELLRRVASGEMVLTQMAETPDVPQKLRELMWRHYVVFWTARSHPRTLCL